MPVKHRKHLRLVHGGPLAREDDGHLDAAPISRDVIDGVVTTLATLARGASLGLALKVGEVVVNEIYRGDLHALRQRGAKDASFRKLAAHPRLPFSAVTLWRSVAIYELVQRMPGLANTKHLGVAHLRAALGLPQNVQEHLLRAAETERWTKERLEDRAAKYRRKKEERKRGRQPMPPPLRTLRQLDRLTSNEEAAVEGLDLGELDERRVRDVQERLDRIRAWCTAVERALRAKGTEAVADEASTAGASPGELLGADLDDGSPTAAIRATD